MSDLTYDEWQRTRDIEIGAGAIEEVVPSVAESVMELAVQAQRIADALERSEKRLSGIAGALDDIATMLHGWPKR